MNKTVYVSGEWLDPSVAGLSLSDRGMLQGVVAVERLRTYCGRLHQPTRYLHRLRSTLEFLGINDAESFASFESILEALVERHALPSDGSDDISVSLIVTPGCDLNAIAPRSTVIAQAMPLPWSRIARFWRQGQNLEISPTQQIPPECWPRNIKVRSRLHYYLADRDAKKYDPNAEALLTDSDGSVTETSTSNLLLFRKGVFFVSPTEQILPGVTLTGVLESIQQAGWKIERRRLLPQDLFEADEVMMSGTTAGLWAVVRVNANEIGTGITGPIVRSLQSLWAKRFGLDLGQQAANRE